MFRKIHQGRNTVFKNIFVENENNIKFPENLVKDCYNAKKKNNDSRSYINSKKILWVHNIGLKTMKEFKKVNKDIYKGFYI